jgi:hypothetical protein
MEAMSVHDAIDTAARVDEESGAGAETRPRQPAAGEPPFRGLRFRRRRADPADGDPIAEALAELVLLREENARLKAARHQMPSLGRVIAHARALPVPGDAEDAADEAAAMLAEVVVLRDSLLEVCAELERSMASLRTRLLAVGTGRPVPAGAVAGAVGGAGEEGGLDAA